jgi:hypothetical protein
MSEREAVLELVRRNKPEELWEHVAFAVRNRRSPAVGRWWRVIVRQHMKALALVGGRAP